MSCTYDHDEHSEMSLTAQAAPRKSATRASASGGQANKTNLEHLLKAEGYTWACAVAIDFSRNSLFVSGIQDVKPVEKV